MTSCALYARISRSDDKTPKTAIQLEQLRKLAGDRGYNIAGEYEDDGLSASKADNRPEFNRLMRDLEAGRFSVIMATEEARLARNMEEKLELQIKAASVGATWETIRDGVVDPAQAAGEFISMIRGAVDRFEGRRKGERQRSSNGERRAKGLPVNCRRPFGWESDQITPRTEEWVLIRQGVDMLLGGSTINAVVKAWNETGVRTTEGHLWSNPNVKQILRRWRNAGWTEHRGEPVAEAVWEPICTRRELEDVRVILRAKATGVQNGNPAGIASGLARCLCGEKLIQAGKQNGVGRGIYRCKMLLIAGRPPGRHVSIIRDTLNEAVVSAVLLCYLEAPRDTATYDADVAKLADLRREHERVERSVVRLHDIYGDPDTAMTRQEYTARARTLRAQLGIIDDQINALIAVNVHTKMLVKSREAFLVAAAGEGVALRNAAVGTPERDALERELRTVWDSLSLEEQRRLVEANLLITVKPGNRYARNRIRVVNRVTGRVMNTERTAFVFVPAIQDEQDEDNRSDGIAAA